MLQRSDAEDAGPPRLCSKAVKLMEKPCKDARTLH
jgi:hypothetical protein